MNLNENISRVKELMGLVTEEFDWDFVNKIVTQEKSEEIYNLLLKMFPEQKEIIDYQYNDEMGVPFAEWRRTIYEIKDWVLTGPILVDPNEINLEDEYVIDRQQKFDDYVSGKSDKYFRENPSDPRKVNFGKLPPITLRKNDKGYEVVDGAHRVFLAKMKNKPLKAYVWVNEPNNSPYVDNIQRLFN